MNEPTSITKNNPSEPEMSLSAIKRRTPDALEMMEKTKDIEIAFAASQLCSDTHYLIGLVEAAESKLAAVRSEAIGLPIDSMNAILKVLEQGYE